MLEARWNRCKSLWVGLALVLCTVSPSPAEPDDSARAIHDLVVPQIAHSSNQLLSLSIADDRPEKFTGVYVASCRELEGWFDFDNLLILESLDGVTMGVSDVSAVASLGDSIEELTSVTLEDRTLLFASCSSMEPRDSTGVFGISRAAPTLEYLFTLDEGKARIGVVQGEQSGDPYIVYAFHWSHPKEQLDLASWAVEIYRLQESGISALFSNLTIAGYLAEFAPDDGERSDEQRLRGLYDLVAREESAIQEREWRPVDATLDLGTLWRIVEDDELQQMFECGQCKRHGSALN